MQGGAKMSTTKKLIKALAELVSVRERIENKEWLATRKQIGINLDPERVDVCWQFAQVLDPYGLCPSFPKELYLVGREYFARPSHSDTWVSFDDLPKTSADRLWQRMQAGHFDDLSDPLGPALWQPTIGPLAAVDVAGRLACRGTNQVSGRLIVKPTDCETSSFILIIREVDDRFRFGGWTAVRTAKRFPILNVRGVAAHFVRQDQLGTMEDCQQYLRSCPGKQQCEPTTPGLVH
jgi:hypothetical protein